VKIFINKLLIGLSLFFVSHEITAAHAVKKPQIQIRTTAAAILYVKKSINDFPSNGAQSLEYEKSQSDLIIKCAKALYDTARNQLLDALSEIDTRITYWQYQKDHPWNYFVSKNPVKWVTGPKQDDEVEDNLEALKSHQGELYVLLGQLSELGNDFTQGYKNTFLIDYKKAYEWVDKLLDTLVRIPTKIQPNSSNYFINRAKELLDKLEHVNQFKDHLLSDIKETEVPSYVARNWLKSGAILLGLNYYGYRNLYDNISSALTYGREKGSEYVFDPVKGVLTDVFNAGQPGKGMPFNVLSNTSGATLKLAKEFVTTKGAKYGIDVAEQEEIKKGLEKEDYGPYQAFLDNIANQENISPEERSRWQPELYQNIKSGLAQFSNLSDFAQGKVHLYELFLFNLIANQQRQYAAVGKLVLLIPAVFATGTTYALYQKITTKDYSPLRRALIEINSLFVDSSKPLTDEQYGKMIYLIHMLKKRAENELPTKKNVRANFIADLEKIESKEFNVAAKRAIVDDMFRKYEFLK
jgi:hypothetical protein